jgi:flavin reductase (DIM6/NTAB) family NADH-FMN oxidoreductase RutF
MTAPAVADAIPAFRQTMANVAASVAVVTADVDGSVHGVTISSLISLSLDPPLVLFALNRSSSMLRHLAQSCFALTVLNAQQREIAAALARRDRPPVAPQWLTRVAEPGSHSVAVIRDGAAWVAAKFERACPVGDHVIVIGHVLQAAGGRMPPLIYHRRSYGSVLQGIASPAETPS